MLYQGDPRRHSCMTVTFVSTGITLFAIGCSLVVGSSSSESTKGVSVCK